MTAVAVVTRHTPSSGHALHVYTPPTTCPHWLSWDRFLPLGGEGSLSEPAFLPKEEGRDGASAPPVPAWNTGAEGVSVKRRGPFDSGVQWRKNEPEPFPLRQVWEHRGLLVLGPGEPFWERVGAALLLLPLTCMVSGLLSGVWQNDFWPRW